MLAELSYAIIVSLVFFFACFLGFKIWRNIGRQKGQSLGQSGSGETVRLGENLIESVTQAPNIAPAPTWK